MQWRLGTMGFSYSDWSGVFYPPEMKPAEYLSFYSRFFDAVELDTTFYATPAESTIRKWRDVTPDHFRFCPKAPRAATHETPLNHAIRPMNEFVSAMRRLGEKLAVVVVQFPPSLTNRNFDRLRVLLGELPRDVRFAMEFRDRSWFTRATEQLLIEHGCAWVSADYVHEPAQLHVTTDFLYVRLIGEHDRFKVHNAEQVDVSARLAWWKQHIEAKAQAATSSVARAYVIFSNDYAGYSVATANRFRRLIGEEACEPSPADKGQLFG